MNSYQIPIRFIFDVLEILDQLLGATITVGSIEKKLTTKPSY